MSSSPDGIGRRGSLRLPKLLRNRPSPVVVKRAERPQVVAHRGASSDVAEHTLAAYRKALDEGADALECDVRLTADGHLVCVHDRRIERTSNGRGPVSVLELQELEQLDFHSWKQPWSELDQETYGVDVDGAGVLTLERLLDTIHDYPRPVEVAIEAKHPTRYAGLVEHRLVELLDRYGWARPRRGLIPPVRVMSFSWLSLRRVLEFAPGLPTVFLMERIPLRYRDGSLPLGAQIAGISVDVIRSHPTYVDKVHDQGHEVHVWTVNEPSDVERCRASGVDAIITDRPAAVIAQVGGCEA